MAAVTQEASTRQRNTLQRIRRVVTGVDAQGRSTIVSDALSPFFVADPEKILPVPTDVWKTFESPARIDGPDESCSAKVQLAPPPQGSVCRMVQFPPDADYMDSWDPQESFSAVGAGSALGHVEHKTPGMHKTASVDYAIVISGEIWAVMEASETLLKAGDVLVQRGTNHAWSNRSDVPALVAFVLIGGQ